MNTTDRITGGLYGLLVGDALGVPYEFSPPEAVPATDSIDYQPPAGFHRAHSTVPPATWSDDGAQALCLLASLLAKGYLDVDDFGRRLLSWLQTGYCAVDNVVFDVGIQTRSALSALRSGVPATRSGPAGERDNGNGSLMRVLPLALWHTGDDAELVEAAMAQSRVTHGHPRSQVCCAVYCLWARYILRQTPEAWTAALDTFSRLYPQGTAERQEFDTHIAPPHGAPPGRGSGYVVDCLHSAHDCVDAGADYESVVKAAIRLGQDTDTTAAVAGGIAGIQYGFNGIPTVWSAALRGQDVLSPLVDELLLMRGGDR